MFVHIYRVLELFAGYKFHRRKYINLYNNSNLLKYYTNDYQIIKVGKHIYTNTNNYYVCQ